MTERLVLPEGVAAAILDHVRAELPLEACGLLTADPRSGAVTRFHPARNALASRYAFEIDAAELIALHERIEADGELVAGVVHSHPATPPVPSARDLREASMPVPYLIVGFHAVNGPRMRGWRIETGAAREVPVRVEPAQQVPTVRRSTISPAAGSTTRSSPQEPSSPPDR